MDQLLHKTLDRKFELLPRSKFSQNKISQEINEQETNLAS